MGIAAIGVVLAPALGPTVGGLLVDNYGWRSVFFLGVPVAVHRPGEWAAFTGRAPARSAGFDLPGFGLLSRAARRCSWACRAASATAGARTGSYAVGLAASPDRLRAVGKLRARRRC